jgi:hypothetical protein
MADSGIERQIRNKAKEPFCRKGFTEKLQDIHNEILILKLENIQDPDNWEYEQARTDIRKWRRRILKKFDDVLGVVSAHEKVRNKQFQDIYDDLKEYYDMMPIPDSDAPQIRRTLDKLKELLKP